MIKVSEQVLQRLESLYPGIQETIYHFEGTELPVCARCGSGDTASVQCGLVGRSINLAGATSKVKLLANPPLPGKFYCNSCGSFF